MGDKDNIIGFFASFSATEPTSTDEERQKVAEEGILFRSYLWGEKGISNILKTLQYQPYGNDIILILFKFYVKPIPYLKDKLKEIENYRKKERAIGILIVITEENFFAKSDKDRYAFFIQSILEKLDILEKTVKKKKLDTKIELLKSDITNLFIA